MSRGPSPHPLSPKGRAWRELFLGSAELVNYMQDVLRKEARIDIRTYDVYVHLSEADGPLRMGDLARAVVMSKSGLTALVDRLEREGVLERVEDPDDRRATRISMTASGKEQFRAAAKIHRGIVHQLFFDVVTEEEAGVLESIMARLRDRIGPRE